MKKQLSNNYRSDPSNFEVVNNNNNRIVEEEEENKNKPVIYADLKERKILRELEHLNAEVEIKSLVVADYQVSEKVAIEERLMPILLVL